MPRVFIPRTSLEKRAKRSNNDGARSESEEGNAMKDSRQTCMAKLARGRIMSEHRNKQLPRVSTSGHYIPSGISEVIGRWLDAYFRGDWWVIGGDWRWLAIIGTTLHSRNRSISEVLKPVKTQGSIKKHIILLIYKKIHGEPRPWGNEATVSYVLRILQWRARYASSAFPRLVTLDPGKEMTACG